MNFDNLSGLSKAVEGMHNTFDSSNLNISEVGNIPKEFLSEALAMFGDVTTQMGVPEVPVAKGRSI